jgi:oligopeptide/dipeptide ABC transporter ATP-binding protein
MAADSPPLLSVRDLKTYFTQDEGTVKAVDGVSFDLYPGATLGIVGESGCGKSVTARSILGIVDRPGRIVGGEIRFRRQAAARAAEPAVDLAKLAPDGPEIRAIRGAEIALIFQEPMSSFSPVHTIGSQITEVIMLHQRISRGEARQKAIEILKRVGVSSPEQRVDQLSNQLSGGLRQRAMIAMALSCHPTLLIADEPTTALDVTTQTQILELLRQLQREDGMAIMLITHDLGVVAEVCDRVAVMHAGQIVEVGAVRAIFARPLHPYTQALVRSIPRIDRDVTMEPIPGMVPSLLAPPSGCRYADRCPSVLDVCRRDRPKPRAAAPDHEVACHAAEVEDATARG